MENSSRPLLIAILAVVSLNLIATSMQIGLQLRTGDSLVHNVGGSRELPSRYSPAVLQGLADRVIAPYNLQDGDAVYALLDDIARNQISRDKFDEQLRQLTKVIGKVESAAFAGSEKQENQGSLDMYKLNYVVKLSGSAFPSGTMTISVVDRAGGPGILGFFIYGRSQQ